MMIQIPTYDAALHSPALLSELIASLTPRSVEDPVVAEATTPTQSNPFFDAMRSNSPVLQVNRPTLHPTSSTENLTLTENGGVTLLSTESSTLDLYLELGGHADKSVVKGLMTAAWEANALETLKIFFSTRSIGRGKGSKEGLARGLAYLAQYHPQTFLNNLEEIVKPLDPIPQKKVKKPDEELDMCEVDEEEAALELNPKTARSHGSYKDLFDILLIASLEARNSPTGSQLFVEGDFSRVPGYEVDTSSEYYATRHQQKRRKIVHTAASSSSVATPSLSQLDVNDLSEDPFNRALRLKVVHIVGEALKRDAAYLAEGKALQAEGQYDEARSILSRISPAAKWAPTQGNMHDKLTNVAVSLAEYLTPSETRSEASLKNSLMVYRKKYLVPLREYMEIVERKMSAKEWSSIKYSRVPSLAMAKNKRLFFSHDEEGFMKYLNDVATGKKTISGATSTPATLFKDAVGDMWYGAVPDDPIVAQVAEAQWNTLVESIRDAGTLSSAIGMVDVSGSMMSPQFKDGTTPIHSAVALGILISLVTAPPFSGSIISFTDKPAFIDFQDGSTLKEKFDKIEREGTGYNTDFIGAFREVLRKAIKAKLLPDALVRKIFVFSDMQFDVADSSAGQYETHYDIVKREYEAAGYEIPQLVFWNLAGGRSYGATLSKPVDKSRPGCAMVSGYSAATLKVFLKGGDFEEVEEEWEEVNEQGEVVVKKVKANQVTPEMIMRKALAHPSFNGLKVYD